MSAKPTYDVGLTVLPACFCFSRRDSTPIYNDSITAAAPSKGFHTTNAFD